MSLRRIVRSTLILTVSMLLVSCGTGSTPSNPPMTATARFAFVANSSSNSISTYAIDAPTGHLTPKDTVPTEGMGSRVIAVQPSGRFAYVGNLASNDISVFAIDANTGNLTMAGSPVPAGNGPRFIVVGPTGNVLYAVNQEANNISGFSVNPSTGALTLLSGTVPTDEAPVELRFHPSGQFAYVANFNSGDVTVYRVDSSGALALLGATPVGLSLSSISMHPSEDLLSSLAWPQIRSRSSPSIRPAEP
jgi:6-phosphogluconolactonase